MRFLSSGSEAVDQAMLIARLYTQRPIIVAFQHAFHGSTLGAGGIGTRLRGYGGGLSSPEDPTFLRTVPGYPLAGSAVVPASNCFRCPLGYTHPACTSVFPDGQVPCLHAAEELIRNLGPENVAALIAEPMSVTGVPNPPEYVRQIRELTTRLGILWIDDEIITGFGRTGTWFAYQWSGVTPDIMTIGKAFTNATIPMSATIVSREIADFFSRYRWMVGGTHAGNPIAAAAAVAAIETYRDEGLIERGQELGEYLGPKLRELAARHPCVGWVTGRGAFWSLELTKDATTREPFVPEGRDRDLRRRPEPPPGRPGGCRGVAPRGLSAARRPGDRAARSAVDRDARALRRRRSTPSKPGWSCSRTASRHDGPAFAGERAGDHLRDLPRQPVGGLPGHRAAGAVARGRRVRRALAG